MFLAEKIGNDYKSWEGGEIFIESQTGTGKTTFVLDVLVPYAMEREKEVLFFSNRFLLKEQIKAKIARKQGLPMEEYGLLGDEEEFDGITIMTYQKLQKICQHSGAFEYAEKIQERYMYIVYDEIHYVLQDATFNPEILYLLQFVKAYAGTEIFLSATMDELPEFLMDWKYENNIDFRNCLNFPDLTLYEIRKISSSVTGFPYWMWRYKFPENKCNCEVRIFEDFEELMPIINQKNEEKWLIFMGNKSKMEEYKNLIKVPYNFLTADSAKLDETAELINEIRLQEQFPNKVLLTTKILDNGINIKDRKVENIVIDTDCKTEFLQMFGRKRILDGDDKFRLFIPQKTSSYFSGLLKLRVEPALDFLNSEHTTSELLRLIHNKDEWKMISNFYTEYRGKLVCNPAGKFKLETEKRFYERMLDEMKNDPWAFAKIQMSWLHIEEKFSEEISITYQNYKRYICEISTFFAKYEGVKMGKSEREKFRELLDKELQVRGISIVKNGRMPGKSAINNFLESEGIKYWIRSNKISKKGEKTFWIIEGRECDVLSD